ncbi:MAG: helix-turn-helix transcriptional regulator, partial [Ruminococcaceae bacterium]|nr:helix-turn-helix transcriptional regulator [Oscillospiraceae bacterium]
QKQLAGEIGVTRSQVANWENSIREPDAMECLRLANFFLVTSDYLCGRVNERRDIPPFYFRSIYGEIINDAQYRKALEVYFELLETTQNRNK